MVNPHEAHGAGRSDRSARVRSRVFWMPRAGYGTSQYEDAFQVSRDARLPFRAAVADGATEAVFSGIWARQMVTGYVNEGAANLSVFGEHLRRWQERWREKVTQDEPALPWYTAAKVEEGAFAAFLGVTILESATWQAHAVGDCNLFQVRGEELLLAWPLEAPDQFTSRPRLVPSRRGADIPDILVQDGSWYPGDLFVLASDAIAAWLLQYHPRNVRHWNQDDFRQHVLRPVPPVSFGTTT